MKTIYLDSASSAPVFKEVIKESIKLSKKNYGNAGSNHALGEMARKEIDKSRKIIAQEIGAKEHEIIFTSSATEANNLALFGFDFKKLILSSIEHSSVYEPSQELARRGKKILIIKVNKEGFIDLNEIEKNLGEGDMLSVIHGNNELGVLQDLKKMGEICKRKNAILHVDASQSFCKERINVREMNISLLSASGHKIGAGKGAGFLFVKEGIKINPLFYGGSQENSIRPGTENVQAISSLGKSVEIIRKMDFNKVKTLRDYFIQELEKIDGKINGSKERRVFNNINVTLNCDAENLQLFLSEKGVMCSTRSACNEKSKKENRVLKALGLSEKEANQTLRFSLWFNTTKKDIDYTINLMTYFAK